MFRILDRYLFVEFVKIHVFSTLASMSISIIVDLIEKIDTYIDNKAAFGDVVLYYAYNIPYISVLTLPAATLIATIFTISQAEGYNEITAMKASGISLYRIFAPLFVGGVILTVTAFLFGEFVVPHTNILREELYNAKIVKRVKQEKGIKRNFLYKGDRGLIYSIDLYDIAGRRMEGVVIHRRGPRGNLRYRLDAESSVWDGGEWVFMNGYLRYFGDNLDDATLRFVRMKTQDIGEVPQDFEERQKKPHEMGYVDLGKYIERMERSGKETHEERVHRAFKISFPFANIIIVLFGASLASNTRSGGAAVSIGLSLFIFIVFWGFVHVGKALGENGVLPPIPAAWLTNAIVGCCGFILLLRARK